MGIDVSALKDSILKGHKEVQKGGGEREFVNISFMKQGHHVLRLFADPNSQFYQSIVYHSLDGQKTKCRGKDCAICKVGYAMDEVKEGWAFKSKVQSRKEFKFYIRLEETNTQDKYWEPGKVYCVLMRQKLAKNVIEYINELIKSDISFVVAMLDPAQPCSSFKVYYEGGTQGTINTSVDPIKKSMPVPLGSWYVPLEDVYRIPDDEESYNKVLELANRIINGEEPSSEKEENNKEENKAEEKAPEPKLEPKAEVKEEKETKPRERKVEKMAAMHAESQTKGDPAGAPECFGNFMKPGIPDPGACTSTCAFNTDCLNKTYNK